MGADVLQRGVSDHVRGRRLGRRKGHFGWSPHATVPSFTASPARVELVRAAKRAARSARALSRGDDCSSEQTEGASSRLSTTRDWHWTGCSRGETPRARPCCPHGSPLWVSSPSLYTCLNIPELATFAFGERVNSNANSRRASDRLPKRPRPRSRPNCFRQRVLRTVATTRLHIRATSSFLVGAGPDRRRLRASSKARTWQR
jgi:hypothetical protein